MCSLTLAKPKGPTSLEQVFSRTRTAGSLCLSGLNSASLPTERTTSIRTSPMAHDKLVYVTAGEILDVALDVRKGSPTYGESYSAILSGDNHKSLYMGKGIAHGFLTLSESATVVYLTSTVHSVECDKGVKWDSFGFDWGLKHPILSDRDKSFPGL